MLYAIYFSGLKWCLVTIFATYIYGMSILRPYPSTLNPVFPSLAWNSRIASDLKVKQLVFILSHLFYHQRAADNNHFRTMDMSMWFKGSMLRSTLLHSEAKSSANVRFCFATGRAQRTCFQWHYWKYTTESGNRTFSPVVNMWPHRGFISPSIKRRLYTTGCQSTDVPENSTGGGRARGSTGTENRDMRRGDHAPSITPGTCSALAHSATGATRRMGSTTQTLQTGRWKSK